MIRSQPTSAQPTDGAGHFNLIYAGATSGLTKPWNFEGRIDVGLGALRVVTCC